jgi:hypothetical protein
LMQRHQIYSVFVCLPSTQYILATDLSPQNKPCRMEERSSKVEPFYVQYTFVCLCVCLFVCLSVCLSRFRCLRR